MAFTKRYAHIDLATNGTQNKLDAAEGYISGSLAAKGVSSFGDVSSLQGRLGGVDHGVTHTAHAGDIYASGSLFVQGLDVSSLFENDLTVGGAFVVDSLLNASVNKVTVKATSGLSVVNDLDVKDGSIDGVTIFHVEASSAYIDVPLTAHNIMPDAGGSRYLGQVGSLWAQVSAETLSASMHIYAGEDLEVANSRVVISSGADLTIKNSAGQVQFSVDGDTGDTTINGDTTVNGTMHINGDVIVDGQAFTLDSVSLLIEDKNIVLANVTGSGGSTDTTASGGGITISGSSNKTIAWYKANATGDSDAAPYDHEGFYVNQSWMPQADVSYDLGKSNDRWKEVHARTGSFAHLDVTELSVFGGLATFNAGGTVPSPQTFTIEAGATLEVVGTANYVNISASGNITADGRGTFGSLTVGGVDLSPMAATAMTQDDDVFASPARTPLDKTAALFTIGIAPGEMIKIEMDLIAKSSGSVDNGSSSGASFKYSFVADRNGDDLVIEGLEIVKDKFGTFGTELDVNVVLGGGNNTFIIKAVQGSNIVKTYWSAQIVKKMKMTCAGVVIEDRI
jgi:hypothetical protein